MKKLNLIVLTLAVATVIVGCKKKGDFFTDKDTYKQGEVITVTNTTEKEAKHYKWDFGGEEVIAENPVYEIPENAPVGTFTISILPVNSLNTTDNWKRNSKTVTIEEAEQAKFLFYLPTPWTGSADEECTITRYNEDGSVAEIITIDVDADYPDCGSSNNPGAATFDNLKSGEHEFLFEGSSSSGGYTVGATLELEDGFDCRIVDVNDML